jgi:hypothetical protein
LVWNGRTDSILDRLFTKCPIRGIKSLYQLAQHRNNTNQNQLAIGDSARLENALSDKRIKETRALSRRPSRIIEKLRSARTLRFAIAFGRVEQGGKARSIKLVAYFPRLSCRGLLRFFDQRCHPSDELEF